MTALTTARHMPGNEVFDDICDLRHQQMTICDGLGGILSLDLTTPGLDELARACNALLESNLPPGACVIRVWAGDATFMLRRVKRAPATVGVTRLGPQAREILLAEDVLRLVIQLLNHAQPRRTATRTASSSLISYTL